MTSGVFDSDELVALLESAASPLVAVDVDGVIRYANPASATAFDYAVEEMVGREVEMLIPAELVAEHRRLRARWADEPVARAHGGGLDFRGRRKDGSVFPVEIAITPVESTVGDLALVGLVDLSARIAAEWNARHLSRAHLAMAELNDAAARASDVEELMSAGLAAFAKVDERATVTAVRDRSGAVAPEVRAALDRAGDGAEPYVGPGTRATDRVAVLPVRLGGARLARVVIESPGALLDDPSIRSVLDTMVGNLSLGVERLAQRDRLHRLDAQRIELFRRLLDAQDEERRRIAAGVHDDSVQALAALQLRVGLLERRADRDCPELADALAQVDDELGRVMIGLRALIFDLEPVSTSSGLTDVVAEVLDNAPLAGLLVRGPVIDWSALPDDHHTPDLLDLAPPVLTQAARILKEALRNVSRHAHASSVEVVVTPDADGVEIAVLDDGIGPAADDTQQSPPGHRGVTGMLDRASLCGGWCRLERNQDTTALRFWLPRTGPS